MSIIIRMRSVAIGTALSCGLFCSWGEAQARDEGSLRVATFNTYLLSNKFRCLNFRDEPGQVVDKEIDITGKIDCLTKNSLPGMPTPDEIIDQADQIADSILSLGDKIDVIMLNEVWDEGAKKRLDMRLRPTFPNIIRRVDAGLVLPGAEQLESLGVPAVVIPGFEGEDSGLMYFARRDVKFLPMKGKPTPVPAGGVRGTTNEVRAQTYSEGAGIDAVAAKGIAAVHVEHLVGQQTARAYLLFTHMQADSDQAETREQQFAQIEKFIDERVIDPNRPIAEERARVFVLGDLNVQGRNALLPVPAGASFEPEWHSQFTEGFPGLRLADTWARDNSEKYPGPTYLRSSIAESDRLDYLLAPSATATVGYCVQHAQVLLDDSRSDHSALVADLNKQFHFCSPRTAATPPFDVSFNPALGSVADATRIAFPGSMQWFRFAESSAATLDVIVSPGTLVTPRMFASTDLSRTIAPVDSKQRITTWSVPADFFIQTAGNTRAMTGEYTITFHKRLCSSATEPCFLTPTVPQEATFPANDLLGADDAAWFRMDVTEAADSGKPQQVQVLVRAPKTYTVSLHNADNLGEVLKSEKFNIVGRGTVLALEVQGTPKLMLKVARDNSKSVPATIRAQWTNNLTVTDVSTLICFDETDGFLGSEAGEDEIALVLDYDGISRRTPASGFTDFDCNTDDDEDKSFKQLIRSIGPLQAHIIEDDDSSDDNPSAVLPIAPIGTKTLQLGLREIRWKPFEEGDYGLRYEQRIGSSGLPPK